MKPVVYAIARWADVFETAESRKYKHLTWIAERTAFDSTGWQTGLETFGPTRWVSVYGAWMIILRVAATAKRRGVLAGDRGEPFSANRIARPAGVDPTLIEDAMQWAIESGWLVPLDISPGDSPGDLPDHREKIIATGQNRTEPNRTGPDRTGQRNSPARPGPEICKQKQPTTILAAMQLRAAKEPRVLEILERKIDNCEGAPTEQLQCWTESCGWKDEHILNLAKGRDIESRSIARSSVLAWYRRQLFAPDPVIFESSAAAAIAVLAMAEYSAAKPGLNNRVGWFRSRVNPEKLCTEIALIPSKFMSAAVKAVISNTF